MAERDTELRSGELINPPVAEATLIEAGKLVCANSDGYAVEGSTTTGLTALGRAEETVDNTAGADGDVKAKVRRGAFKFANSATNAVTQASVGKTVYIEDGETVAKDDGAAGENPATKSAAGKCIELDADGVWVEVR
jgi:hypothetical protein